MRTRAKAVLGVVSIVLLAVTVWFATDTWALRRLQDRLGYGGDSGQSPIAYFRERIRERMSAAQVDAAIDQYDRTEYYIVPVAGTTDSALVQRFVYPLVWGDLKVDVHYRNGKVWDVEVDEYGMARARAISVREARERIGPLWSPEGAERERHSDYPQSPGAN